MSIGLKDWECKIDAPQAVHIRDPRARSAGTQLPFRAIKEGVLIDGPTAAYVYLTYRPVCPSLTGSPYEETLVYAKGAQVYWQGSFYAATASVPKYSSPGGSPSLWEKLPIPRRWELALIELTYARMLRYWAGMNKAEDNEYYRAMTHARNVLDRLKDEEQGQIGTTQRLEVYTR